MTFQTYNPNIELLSTVKKQGQQHRSFCSKWFKEYNWISFCNTRNKVFCYHCRKSAKMIASSVLNQRTERLSLWMVLIIEKKSKTEIL